MQTTQLNALELLETLRNRSMYGDAYVAGKPHVFNPYSWAGNHVLIAAACHFEHGRSCYPESTVPCALNWIDCGGFEVSK